MNKKFSLGVCISLIAIACSITFVVTMTVSLNIYNSKIAGVEEREEIYSKLQEIDSFVRNNYLKEIDKDALLLSILNGYITGTGDIQAKYLTNAEYYLQQQMEKGKIVTAGMEVAREESGYIKVIGVYEGSPAEIRGIKTGDIITAINNTGVLELGAENAIKQLNGDEGTRITITIQRSGEETQYSLVRQLVEIISVNGTVFNGYGFIRINGFSELTGTQFNNTLDRINESGVKGLIIDIRGTSGYLIQPLREIFNRLIPGSVLANAEYKGGSVNNIIVTGSNDSENVSDSESGFPVVVLADANTSGCGELMTAILKDFKNAKTVGNTTAGNAVLTQTQSFRDGSAVRISGLKVSSAGGTVFDGIGIKPDFYIEMNTPIELNLQNLENTNDLQIKKAFEIMETES